MWSYYIQCKELRLYGPNLWQHGKHSDWVAISPNFLIVEVQILKIKRGMGTGMRLDWKITAAQQDFTHSTPSTSRLFCFENISTN